MDQRSLELGQAVTREVLDYYQLVVLARTKHCLLRGGRVHEAQRLADLETKLLANLEVLEMSRMFIDGDPHAHDDPVLSRYLSTMNQTKASLIRRLRPVAQANQAAAIRRVLSRRRRRRASADGKIGARSISASSWETA